MSRVFLRKIEFFEKKRNARAYIIKEGKPCPHKPSAKVLVELFQKLARVEAAEASSPPAGGETNPGVFFLITFSFAPLVSKEKVAEEFAVIKGKPHLWFPLFFLRKNSPLRALVNDQVFRALRSARRASRPPPAKTF